MPGVKEKIRKLSWPRASPVSGSSDASVRDYGSSSEYSDASHALMWSGWLSKTGSKDKAYTAAKRFFKLRADGLFEYYATIKASEPKGIIDLKLATSVVPVLGGFDIHTPQRVWHIQDSEDNPQRLTGIVLLLQQMVQMLLQRSDMEAGRAEDPGHDELMRGVDSIAVDDSNSFACAVFR